MANRSVNKVFLIGNLGRDAETKFTPSGVARTTFSVATTRRIKDNQTGEWKDETDWHNIVLWRSENIANYLTKGKQVHIEGRLQSRSYDDKDGNKRYVTEVVAEELMLLGGRGESGGGDMGMGMGSGSGSDIVSRPRSSGGPRPMAQTSAEPQFPEVASDDDVPF